MDLLEKKYGNGGAQEPIPASPSLAALAARPSPALFWRGGFFSWRLFWPFAVASVPMAFVGGYIQLPSGVLKRILGVVLLGAALRMALRPPPEGKSRPVPWWAALLVGGGIGLLSGLTGTGGGIFLTPLVILAGWANAKPAAALSAAAPAPPPNKPQLRPRGGGPAARVPAAGGRQVRARLQHPDPPTGAAASEWALRAGDFDVLGHVNNAVTWGLLDEEVERRLPGHRVGSAEVEYREPIAGGRAVTVLVTSGEGVLRLWALTDGGAVACTALARVEPGAAPHRR